MQKDLHSFPLFFLVIACGLVSCKGCYDVAYFYKGKINNQDSITLRTDSCEIPVRVMIYKGIGNGIELKVKSCPGTFFTVERVNVITTPSDSFKLYNISIFSSKTFGSDKPFYETRKEDDVTIHFHLIDQIDCKTRDCEVVIPPGQMIFYKGESLIKDTLRIRYYPKSL